MLIDGSGFTLMGNAGPVLSSSFSHSGVFLATAGKDKIVNIWNWAQKRCVLDVCAKAGWGKARNGLGSNQPSRKINSSIFPEEVIKSQFFYLDKFLLTASGNKIFFHAISLDDREGNDNWHKLVKSITLVECKRLTDVSACNQFHSHLVLCACSDRHVRVLDLSTGQGSAVVLAQEVHRRQIHSVVQPPGGAAVDLFATAAAGDGVKLWDLRTFGRPRAGQGGGSVRRIDVPTGPHSAAGTEATMGGRIGCGIALTSCMRFLAAGATDGAVYTVIIENNCGQTCLFKKERRA